MSVPLIVRPRAFRPGHRVWLPAAALVVVLLDASHVVAVELPGETTVARPCRPTVSCTADLTAPGVLETEVGVTASTLGRDERLWAYPILVKQTLARLVQLQVGSNGYTALRDVHGASLERALDNVAAGPKLHVLDQSELAPSVALTLQGSIPLVHGGADGVLATAHASKDAGPVHFDWNVGLDTWWRGGESASTQPFTALAASATPFGPIGIALEAYAFGNAAPYLPRDGGGRLAVTLTPRPWLVFDVGGDVGWYPSTHGHTVFLGMTVIPLVLWQD
jgi:hypothetical protein